MTTEQENLISKTNEISIYELWEVHFQNKFIILLVTFIFGISSIIYALSATELWKAEVIMYASDDDGNQNTSLNSAISQFISPSAQDTKTSKYLAILISRNFLLKFIEEQNIAKNLFEEDWNSKKSDWTKTPPSENSLHRKLKKAIEVERELATGIIKVSFTWHDKQFASDNLNKLIDQLNNHIRLNAVEEYRDQLNFIEDQIKKTNLNQVRSVLFNIVENLSSSIMIAETRMQYAFKVIDYSSPPEFRFFPQRTNLVILWTFIGFFLSCVLTLLVNILKKTRRQNQ